MYKPIVKTTIKRICSVPSSRIFVRKTFCKLLSKHLWQILFLEKFHAFSIFFWTPLDGCVWSMDLFESCFSIRHAIWFLRVCFFACPIGCASKNARPKNWGGRSKFVQPWKLGINNDHLKCDVLPYENDSNFY